MRILRPLLSIFLLAALLTAPLAAVPAAVGSPPADVPAGPRSALPQLVDVRAVHRKGVDRVIFQFDEGIPTNAEVRYVDRLRGDGSGLPIRIAGRATLQVGLSDTRTDRVAPAPVRRSFALPNAMTAVRSGIFEGWTTYGIGLARRAEVEVIRQPARDRVVIAVAAGFATVERQVYFLDRDRVVANQEPYVVPRTRWVLPGSPATGVMDRLFAGPTDQERREGLRLIRSGAAGYTGLVVAGGIARVRLRGGCTSAGSTVTVADEIMPSLRQFDSVDWVKVLDPAGATAAPSGPSDSIPDCLNP